jgi:hypothetical protein
MTELRVDIDRLVLQGVSSDYGQALQPLLEEHLGSLARGAELCPVDGPSRAVADLAQRVWDAIGAAQGGGAP